MESEKLKKYIYNSDFIYGSPLDLDQRCPTHSPLATCGEWFTFQNSHNWLFLAKFGTKLGISNKTHTFLLKNYRSKRELVQDEHFSKLL